MNKLYFVSYGGGHITITNEVVGYLSKHSDYELVVLPLTMAAASVITGPRIQLRKLSDYLHLFDNTIDSIMHQGLALLPDNFNPCKGISKFESLLYLGFSMFNLIENHGVDKAQKMYKEKRRGAFLPIEIFEKILEYERPDAVITTISPRCELAAIRAANQLNILTFQIMDLHGSVELLPEANHITIMNKDFKEELLQRGVNKENVHALGQPAIEQFAIEVQAKRAKRDDIKQQLGITDNKVIVTYCVEPPCLYDESHRVIQPMDYAFSVDEVIKKLSLLVEAEEVEVIVRPHPSEDINHYKGLAEKFRNLHFDIESIALCELYAITDIVVARVSTTAIQAVVSGITTCTFRYQQDHFPIFPIYENEPFIFARDTDLLIDNLTRLVSEKERGAPVVGDLIELNFMENFHKLIQNIVGD